MLAYIFVFIAASRASVVCNYSTPFDVIDVNINYCSTVVWWPVSDSIYSQREQLNTSTPLYRSARGISPDIQNMAAAQPNIRVAFHRLPISVVELHVLVLFPKVQRWKRRRRANLRIALQKVDCTLRCQRIY